MKSAKKTDSSFQKDFRKLVQLNKQTEDLLADQKAAGLFIW